MAKIQISNTSSYDVFIDDHILDEASTYTWFIKLTYGKPYVQGYLTKGATKNTKKVYLHRWIMGAVGGQIIDHVDGNALNNLKANLRFCTHKQNSANRKPNSKGKFASKYKGVTNPTGTRWKVYLKGKFVGGFATEEEAALAYNVAAKKEYGDFARCNILPHGA